MRWTGIFFVAAALCPTAGWAQATASISFGATPKGGNGTIPASGTYTFSGGFIKSITLVAVNELGGEGGEAACTFDASKATGPWSGTVKDLPPGTYSVYARIAVGDTFGTYFFDTVLVERVLVSPLPLTTNRTATGRPR